MLFYFGSVAVRWCPPPCCVALTVLGCPDCFTSSQMTLFIYSLHLPRLRRLFQPLSGFMSQLPQPPFLVNILFRPFCPLALEMKNLLRSIWQLRERKSQLSKELMFLRSVSQTPSRRPPGWCVLADWLSDWSSSCVALAPLFKLLRLLLVIYSNRREALRNAAAPLNGDATLCFTAVIC